MIYSVEFCPLMGSSTHHNGLQGTIKTAKGAVS